MGKNKDKFLLLMWKNLLLQIRHPKQTLIEIIVPVLLSSLLVMIRNLEVPKCFPDTYYVPFQNKIPILKDVSTLNLITWSPWCLSLEEIINDTVKAISADETLQIKHMPFKNSTEMFKFLIVKENQDATLAGIEFDDSIAGATRLDPHINITLRFPGELRKSIDMEEDIMSGRTWSTDLLFPTYQLPGPREPGENEGATPSYYYEGFLKLQQELSYSLINYFKKHMQKKSFDRKTRPLYMQRFPYPKWNADMSLEILESFTTLTIILSFLYPCISTVKCITVEKEKQLKEAMKIMGLPNWLHWTAWFVKTFFILFITVALIVILLKIEFYPNKHTVFTHSNPLIIFLFLLLYSCATITLCFAISVFFSHANNAAAVAGLFWLLTYFPYSLTQNKYHALSLCQKLLQSLFSNSALGYGFHLILALEGIGEGVQWHNIWGSRRLDDSFTLGYIMIMLIIDAIIYLFIALYVEVAFPGSYGVGLPWYFPLTCSYWFGRPRYNGSEGSYKTQNEMFEEEPTHLPVGVEMQHLCKKYSNRNMAVNDLSLNIYKEQITVLLGHNGAGKTTTLSILTGMIQPTSGTAVIEGCDITTNIAGARKSMGLCPQHNILFDEMTVREHLYFYGRLKGLEKDEIKKEIDLYINMLELVPKANEKSRTLSGGTKRKLSIGIALCGGSSVVICDEPTSGMDPAAKRCLWYFLQNQKEGRAIILTTHFMDEADFLGDRIAIMSEGKLQCCGSSFFLKKKYSVGYHLIMEKSSTCIVENVTELLQKYVPDIEMESNVGSELSYLLGEKSSPIFETMFSDLEGNSTQLGVSSFGISFTTLDEVFLKVGANSHEQDNMRQSQSLTFGSSETYQDFPSIVNTDTKTLTGYPLWRNQLRAMFMKRGLSLIRSWFSFLLHIVIPILILSLQIIVIRNQGFDRELPKLEITLDSYSDPVTVVTTKGNYAYSKEYKKYLKVNEKILLDWKGENLSKNIFQETVRNPVDIRMRYICAASFNTDNSTTAWFNNDPFHSPPLTLQLVMNAILHAEVSPGHDIRIFNHPLPFSLDTQIKQLVYRQILGVKLALIIGIGMACVSAFYITFYIKERVVKFKHLQFISGVRTLIFWFSSFICDFLAFILILTCIIATFFIFQLDGFSTLEQLSRVSIIFICFGFSMLPMAYLASYFFKVPSTGYIRITLINICTGVVGLLIVEVLQLFELRLKRRVHWILLLIPHYALTAGIKDIYLIYSTHKVCNIILERCINNSNLFRLTPEQCKAQLCKTGPDCCTMTKDYYDWEAPGIRKNIIFSCSVGAFLFIMLLLTEFRIFKKIGYICEKCRSRPPLPSIANEDDDVLKEKQIVRNATIGEIKKHSIVMRDVTKYYGKVLAVNRLCLATDRYECFGLLGVNGAGKTTTFKIMTGDVRLTSGNVWTNGLSLKTKMKKIRSLVGYCPQFYGLLDELTCRETLVILSLLRGVTFRDSKLIAEKLAFDFGFYFYLDERIRYLSGGTIRRLSTALAVVGDPLVIYLDEPSTGMDPGFTHHLWHSLCKLRDSGKCIVLTSHSMKECEALCTRLAIMVNGSFMCLGSTQHLKSKFSEGYTLIVKAKKTADSGKVQIETFVKKAFPSAVIREKNRELLTFYISDKTLPWSKIFGIMERARKSLNIENYSLEQCNLEQVFLSFTKYQKRVSTII